jgi:hypothetical protein
VLPGILQAKERQLTAVREKKRDELTLRSLGGMPAVRAVRSLTPQTLRRRAANTSRCACAITIRVYLADLGVATWQVVE